MDARNTRTAFTGAYIISATTVPPAGFPGKAIIPADSQGRIVIGNSDDSVFQADGVVRGFAMGAECIGF